MAVEPQQSRQPSPSSGNTPIERVPPHNLDAEVSVIGSMLLSKDAIAEATEHVRAEDFYRGAHRTMFEAALALYDRGEPVDPVSLAEELKRRAQLDDVGGQVEISEIVHRVPTPANAAYYARIVAATAIKRRLIDTGTRITQLGYDETQEAEQAVDSAENLVYQLSTHGRVGDIAPLKELLTSGFEMIEQLHENQSALTGLATGFTDFDNLTAGLQPGNLMILAARPSMGKCCTANTLVFDARTSQLRPIEDMVEAGKRGEELEVLASGPDFKLRYAPVSEVHDNGEQPVLRVRTRLGRELKVTANHPLLTLDGWLPVGMLRPGWRIATPRSLPYFGNQLRPEHEVRMIAYLLGDGAISGPPRFITTNRRLLAEVRECARWFGVGVRKVGTNSCQYSLRAPRGERNPLVECLEEHGLYGTRSAEKFVPQAFFQLPRDQMADFLNRLFACDGCVYVNEAYAQITYTTISERLARQVQHLLLRYGIIAKLHELERPVYEDTGKQAWELQITAPESIRTFSREIGIRGKERRLREARELMQQHRGHPNHDLVPIEVWDRITEAKGGRPWRELSEATLRPPTHNWHVGKRAPSRQLLTEIAEHYQDPVLVNLAGSDIYWDEITEIEPAGAERVYDLTIPEGHNFVAEDVVVHNSTMVVNVASHVTVKLRKPVAIFSLEMSQMELVQRILAGQARVDSDRLRTGRLKEADWPKLSEAFGKLADAPMFIDDTPDVTMMEIRSKCRRLKQQHGLDLVIVDYLQLMQSPSYVESRVQEVAQFSRGMKILAKELDVPVIALSQLSRKPEDRVDHRPQLADLRESGCLPGAARVWRADTGEQVPIGELATAGEVDVPVWSVDADYRLTPARLVRAFPTGRKRVFRLRLRSGRRVEASANHPFLTFDGWTRLDELGVGSRVAVPRRVPEPQAAEPWPEDEVAALGERVAGADAPIPEAVFRLKDSQLERFVARVWTAAGGRWQLDGAHAGAGAAVGAAVVGGAELALGLQRALTRLGVPSRVAPAESAGRHRVVAADDDTLPLEAWDEVRRAMAERGMTPAAFTAAMGLGVCGTTLWQRPPTPAVLARAAEVTGSDHLRRLARADLWWDEVTAVEELGEQPVYDATVAGTHSFLADGVIVENSLEQDADIVSFIYRDEVYDPDSPAKGEAELIVAKHRNGPIGTIPLAFLGSTSRFANLRRGGDSSTGGSREGSPL